MNEGLTTGRDQAPDIDQFITHIGHGGCVVQFGEMWMDKEFRLTSNRRKAKLFKGRGKARAAIEVSAALAEGL